MLFIAWSELLSRERKGRKGRCLYEEEWKGNRGTEIRGIVLKQVVVIGGVLES